MAQGRRLLDDVSMEELLRMRNEEGLSNYEIAERVGVSYYTIHSILGKQPKGIRAPMGLQSAAKARAAAAKEPQIKPKDEDIQPASLVLERRKVELIGLTGRYRVDEMAAEVTVVREDGNGFTLKQDELEEFIKELQAISRHMQKPAPMEAW